MDPLNPFAALDDLMATACERAFAIVVRIEPLTAPGSYGDGASDPDRPARIVRGILSSAPKIEGAGGQGRGEFGGPTKVSGQTVVIGLSAQTIRGTGDNFGGGWVSDGRGGYQGTGDNFGSGWTSDGRGGYQGTGNNFGSGWTSDGRGGYQGAGDNFGRGYSSDGNGGLQGTGGNFGGGWVSNGQGTGKNFGGGWQ